MLRRHCEEVGRDRREIERTIDIGPVIIRDSRDEAQRVLEEIYARNGERQAVARPAGRDAGAGR